jgi:two-component system NtrC family sensor kinase
METNPDQWRLFLQYCPLAIAAVDRQMHYVWVNQRWLEELRLPLELGDVIGKSHYDFFAFNPQQKSYFQKCLQGEALEYSDEINIAQGRLSWHARAWFEHNQLNGLIISHQTRVGEDIAQKYIACMQARAKLEQQLAEQTTELALEVQERVKAEASYAQLGTALESTSDAICILGADGLPFFVNSAFVAMFGFSVHELQKRGINSLFADGSIASKIDQALHDTGSWSGEADMHTKWGAMIAVEVRTNAIRDLNGTRTGAVGIYTNITDRRISEQETRQGFSLLNAALEATADGILVEDLQGNIIICNQKFADLWRIPTPMLQALQTNQIREHILAQVADTHAFLNLCHNLPQEADSFDAVKLKDGRTIERYSQPQRINGECVGRVWGYRDITARVIAEQALRASEQKFRHQAEQLEKALKQLKSTQAQLIQTEKLSSLGQLIAGISHEINNPINFIYGNLFHADNYIEQILELINLYRHYYPEPEPVIYLKLQEMNIDYLLEDFRNLMSSIRIGAERIHGLVQSLHKFSRVDGTERRYADLHAGIDGTLIILHNRLKANAHRPAIQVIKNYGQLPNIECYQGQMNQVFMNILTNAIDALEDIYLPKEETTSADFAWERTWRKDTDWQPCIWITTAVSEDNQAMISIQDNAGGIPEHIRQRIFDPFFTTKPVGKGTGLGLSISYQIITENHGGKLECFTSEGHGTKFVITLPIFDPREEEGTTVLAENKFLAVE